MDGVAQWRLIEQWHTRSSCDEMSWRTLKVGLMI
jgi:hypothetical protein